MYIRVKSKATGHEFDLPEERFDADRYTRVDAKRYPPSSRPRRAKPRVPKGGRPRATENPVNHHSEALVGHN